MRANLAAATTSLMVTAMLLSMSMSPLMVGALSTSAAWATNITSLMVTAPFPSASATFGQSPKVSPSVSWASSLVEMPWQKGPVPAP